MQSKFAIHNTACALFVAVLTIMAAPGSANAQLTYGVSVGFNYGSLSDIELPGSDVHFDGHGGYHVGLFVDLTAGPIGVRPQVLYMSAGPLFRGDPISSIDQDGANVSFITVPVDLRYRMPTPVVSPYLLAGPELRFVRSDLNMNQDDLNSVNVAANIGAGLEIRVPGAGLRFYPEFRYTFDISGLTERTMGVPAVQEQRYSPFMLRLGIGMF